MRALFALAVKDLRILMHDKAGFFFMLVLPLLFAMFFGSIFSGEGEVQNAIHILVVDEDSTAASQAFVDRLQAAPELEVEQSHRQAAVERVRRGRATAYVVLKPGFGTALERIFWGEPPTVELGVDPARRAEAGLLQGVLTKYAAERLQEAFADPDAMRGHVREALAALRNADDLHPERSQMLNNFLGELDTFLSELVEQPAEADEDFRGFQPLVIEEAKVRRERFGPNNAYAVSFPQGIIWTLIASSAGFALSLVTERNRGTLVRLRVAPLSGSQILAGKALACFLTAATVSTFLLILAVSIFGVEPQSPGLLALALLTAVLAFVGMMMLLSVLGRTEQSVAGFSWAVLLTMAMLGGGMVPLFVMPAWMQSLSHLSPVKWAMLALEGAIWRNFSLQEMVLPCAILLGVAVGTFAVGVRAFRWLEQG